MPSSTPPTLPAWPPAQGLCSPTVSREATILQTSASRHISAPASTVWTVLCDTSKYPEWNSFVPHITILSQPEGIAKNDTTLHNATGFMLHVIMDQKVPGHGSGHGGKTVDTQVRVTDVSTPEQPSAYINQQILDRDPGYYADLSRCYRISWSSEGGFVSKGLKTERFHEIVVLGEEECEVRTWECQGGMLARAVKWMYKDVLMRKFGDWCDGLKKESERRHRESIKQ